MGERGGKEGKKEGEKGKKERKSENISKKRGTLQVVIKLQNFSLYKTLD